jgi:peptide-methionine (R)-S-oxide reductase
MNYLLLALIVLSLVALGCERSVVNAADKSAASKPATQEDVGRVEKSNEEWKKILSPQQYEVLREKGTERAFTGAYWDNHEKGTYVCAACGLELFSSDTKFESGTGWPSFWQPLTPARVKEAVDNSHGMVRGEIVCARCGGHLGHVFDDGPKPTGQRYCMNSVSLKFIPAGDKKDKK